MINFKEPFNHNAFIQLLTTLLPDFKEEKENIQINRSFKHIKSVNKVGISKSLDLKIYEVEHESDHDPRVVLSRESFLLMKDFAVRKALVVFKNEKSLNYRLSLITFESKWESGTKVEVKFSNPKRFSFFLGPNAKINTPTKFLTSKGAVIDFDDLKNRFSVEVVNKEFYKDISRSFTGLVNGLLKLPSNEEKSQTNLEFAVRLIGRIIFCWFLREKKSTAGLSLMPKELLSLESVNETKDYYHKILEPIFFEVLNKPAKLRIESFAKEPFTLIPFLNGGLFSPQYDDYYERSKQDLQSRYQNNLNIPDVWFRDFFEILETYNFTIDENTSYDEELSIDPEMLGRIFENLLAEINPETGESARKSTGSYYTPRTIVNYMIDESLTFYLKENTGIEEKKIRALISYDLEDDDENPITLEQKTEVINALEKVKILDPACGSGAFPIGALQKIVFILQQADPNGQIWFQRQINNTSPEIKSVLEREFEHKNFDYIRKLGIIRENIYGVDIQSIATEISRLRCFLTLIVDQTIEDNITDPIRGIEPLPNLEFKFVTANSLLKLPENNTNVQTGLFEDTQNILKLSEIRNKYFNSTGEERLVIKNEFLQIQNSMLNLLRAEHRPTELTHKLATWEPFTHKSTPWFDPEWMFGIKEGFDIVIGNPPYLRVQGIKKDNKALAEIYENSYKAATGSYDLYVLFAERGLSLLNQTGVLNFIMPHKWVNSAFGKGLRQAVSLGNHFYEMISFGSYQIFAVSNYTSLIWLTSKSNSKGLYFQLDNEEITNRGLENVLRGITSSSFSNIDNSKLSGTEWTLVDKITASVLDKINQQPRRVKNVFNRIFQGIASGADEVFFLKPVSDKDGVVMCYSSKLKETIAIEQRILKPLLKGKDIKKYMKPKVQLNVLLPYNIQSSGAKPMTEVELKMNYPNAYKYLKRNENYLRDRENGRFDNPKEWFLLSRNQGLNEVEQPKIITPEISYGTNFIYDETGYYYHNTKCYSLIKNSNIEETYEFFLGILNSRLLWFFLQSTGYVLRGGYFTFSTKYLEPFPLPKANSDVQIAITKLVKDITSFRGFAQFSKNLDKQNQVKDCENQIDQLVYKLYDLKPAEIEIIENST